MDVQQVFRAEPQTAHQVLCKSGEGFYIPPYQREYNWKESDVDTLIRDAVHGLSLAGRRQDILTFIGTLILIKDSNYETVVPHMHGELPQSVMLVIDGQQRLTTLALIYVALHEQITLLAEKLREANGPDIEWLRNKSKELRGRLVKTFELDMDYGECQFYPKIARAYSDTWSRKRSESRYNSSLAKLLSEYISHCRNPEPRQTFTPATDSGQTSKNFKQIREKIKNLSLHEGDDLLIDVGDALSEKSGKTLQESLFFTQLQGDVVGALLAKNDDTNPTTADKNALSLFRLCVFSAFLMDRMAVTVVTAKNEEYAFDIFQALNTTGEPLTAYETFKPLVVRAEGLDSYESSQSKVSMDLIEEHLSRYGDAASKQKATTKLLIPFALGETGYKLEASLSEQRRWLRDEYGNDHPETLFGSERNATMETKRSFVRHLANYSEFIRYAWPKDSKDYPDLPQFFNADEREYVLWFDVFRSLNHNIAIAPLARFYSEWLCSPPGESSFRKSEFLGAIKAALAFSVLWRGATGSTRNIDSRYRELMSGAKQNLYGAPGLCRAKGDKPSLAGMQVALRNMLDSALDEPFDRGSWTTRAASIPIYTHNATLARLMLLLATQDSEAEPTKPGLLTAATPGFLNVFSIETWREMTVEHVAPQTKGDGWSDDLYEKGLVHTLGNLVLVPSKENSALHNRSWEHKRLIFRVLSSTTPQRAEAEIQRAADEGIALSSSTEEVFKASRYLPQVKSLRLVQGPWTSELVSARSENIAGRVWDQVAAWIGL